MTDHIIPDNTETAEGLNFTATPGIYRFCEDVSALDLRDQIAAKQTQLEAMLQVGTDVKGESVDVDKMAEYFWSCQSTAREIGILTREFIARAKRDK